MPPTNWLFRGLPSLAILRPRLLPGHRMGSSYSFFIVSDLIYSYLLHQNLRLRYLYSASGRFSYIIMLLFSFKYPINVDTASSVGSLSTYVHDLSISRFYNIDSFSFAQLPQDFSYFFSLLSIKYLPAIFRCKHYVIFAALLGVQ